MYKQGIIGECLSTPVDVKYTDVVEKRDHATDLHLDSLDVVIFGEHAENESSSAQVAENDQLYNARKRTDEAGMMSDDL